MSIYTISQDIQCLERQLMETLDEETGEVDTVISNALAVKREEFDVKAVNIQKYIVGLNADNAAIDGEIDRLKALKKRNDTIIKSLKKGVATAMNALGIEEVSTPTMRITYSTSEETVIDDKDLLPAALYRQKITYEPDKTAIKKAIQNGETICGAHLQTNYNLRVK